jgi:hypothetical protein
VNPSVNPAPEVKYGVSGLESLVCEDLKPVILVFGFKVKTGGTVVFSLESLVIPASRFGICGQKTLF